jgi:hypothetical protein
MQQHWFRYIYCLVYGHYRRSEEQLTKGNILTADGTLIDSVILGRVISFVKDHLNLEKPHLWVVYPPHPSGK